MKYAKGPIETVITNMMSKPYNIRIAVSREGLADTEFESVSQPHHSRGSPCNYVRYTAQCLNHTYNCTHAGSGMGPETARSVLHIHSRGVA